MKKVYNIIISIVIFPALVLIILLAEAGNVNENIRIISGKQTNLYSQELVPGNVKWTKNSETYLYNGKSYNIYTLTAEPVSDQSNLVTKVYQTGETEFLYLYSCRIYTTVSFKYVSTTDNLSGFPVLSYVSTKNKVYTDCQYKNLKQVDSEGISPVTNKNKKTYYTAYGYNSNIYAIKGYINMEPGRSYVDKINLLDLRSKINLKVYPICPFYPAQVY